MRSRKHGSIEGESAEETLANAIITSLRFLDCLYMMPLLKQSTVSNAAFMIRALMSRMFTIRVAMNSKWQKMGRNDAYAVVVEESAVVFSVIEWSHNTLIDGEFVQIFHSPRPSKPPNE
jgi:hypothetical protein